MLKKPKGRNQFGATAEDQGDLRAQVMGRYDKRQKSLRAELGPTPTMPFTDAQMREWGFTAWRILPDGSVLAVGPISFGNGRLYVDVSRTGYADCYCYDSLALAEEYMLAFDPARDAEPTGWKRHPVTGRRRPNGDASAEYVAL